MNEHPIHAFSHDLVETLCVLSPVNATFVGVKGHDHAWDDFGPAGHHARREAYRDLAARLASLPAADSPDVELALRVHREHVDERLESFSSDDHYFDLNNITSTFQLLTVTFDFMTGDDAESAADLSARLDGLPSAAAKYRALLDEGRTRGRTVARRQVQAAIAEGRAKSGTFSQRYGERAAAADRAYTELTDWLEREYLPRATTIDGVGEERYRRSLRRFLGTNLDLHETYAWGFEEIRRIESAMASLATRIAPGKTVREVAAQLASDPSANADVPEPFLETMRARQRRALELLGGSHFDVPEPIRKLEVRLASPGGKPGAYYTAPSEDFSRPGIVWYSPGSRASMPLWQEITTAYHEGFPGHHLQVGTQVQKADRLTRYQRLFAEWSGFAEGWALYAERLMLELGFFERPEYELGMWLGELARACRVVVDIGLHLDLVIPETSSFHPGERWTYELAVELMRDRALMDPELAASEVVRYLGWPGQAISYKVGQRALLDLRAKYTERNGADSLREFHRDVLSLGCVPLGLLEGAVLSTPRPSR